MTDMNPNMNISNPMMFSQFVNNNSNHLPFSINPMMIPPNFPNFRNAPMNPLLQPYHFNVSPGLHGQNQNISQRLSPGLSPTILPSTLPNLFVPPPPGPHVSNPHLNFHPDFFPSPQMPINVPPSPTPPSAFIPSPNMISSNNTSMPPLLLSFPPNNNNNNLLFKPFLQNLSTSSNNNTNNNNNDNSTMINQSNNKQTANVNPSPFLQNMPNLNLHMQNSLPHMNLVPPMMQQFNANGPSPIIQPLIQPGSQQAPSKNTLNSQQLQQSSPFKQL